MAEPLVVFVTVKIASERLDAFHKAMAIDVEGSRKEEGCLRFDLLQGDEENVFHFYEVRRANPQGLLCNNKVGQP